MNIENVTQYVCGGIVFDEKVYRVNSIVPLLFSIFLAPIVAGALNGFGAWMLLVMWAISIACIIAVFAFSKYGVTIMDFLYINAATISTWVLDLGLLEIMCYIRWRGATPWVLLVFVPVILIPTLLGIITHINLKKPDYNPKKVSKGAPAFLGFASGISGMIFASGFKDASQETAFMLLFFCFFFLNALMSLGLISFQKLYYAKKYNLQI